MDELAKRLRDLADAYADGFCLERSWLFRLAADYIEALEAKVAQLTVEIDRLTGARDSRDTPDARDKAMHEYITNLRKVGADDRADAAALLCALGAHRAGDPVLFMRAMREADAPDTPDNRESAEAFIDRLRAAGADAWDNVDDPQGYIRAMRDGATPEGDA